MRIGIHPDKAANESYSDKFTEYLLKQGVEVCPVNLLAHDALDQANDFDGIIWRWLHRPGSKQSAKHILYVIEHRLQVPVFPNSTTTWHYDNKVAQHYLLSAMKVPYIRTWVFWNSAEAIRWVEQASFPLVFKLSTGASSANVLKIDDRREAEALIYKMFNTGVFPYTYHEYSKRLNWLKSFTTARKHLKNVLNLLINGEYPPLDKVWWKPEFGYIYFQEFLPNNQYDTRVTVIGNRAFAFRRFNRPDDFRASGSGKLDMSPEEIDVRCISIAFEVSKKTGVQSMAYDFLYDMNGQPMIVEVSYTFADWAVQRCPGHWDENLRWIEGNLWPEEAIAEDFINEIKNKAP